MKRIKRIAIVTLSVSLMFSMSGCGILDKMNDMIIGEGGITNNSDNKSEVSNSISVGILDFDTFNPLLTKSETVKECMQFVYEPLFEVDKSLRPIPVLAENYSISADGRVIDITLKNDVLWHDGSNFTAYDAAYTIKNIRAGITEYTEALANVADYMATGDYSLRITLKSAVPDFVSLLNFPIVKFQSDMKMNPNHIPIGTGAFRYDSQMSTGKLSFSAFENFHGGRAVIDNIYVYTVPDLQKYESMFEANEIDIITGETVDFSEYTPRGSSRSNEYITNKMTFVGYNCNDELLNGAQTRIGISNLIDKDSIVNSTIYSHGVACDIPINPSSLYYYDTNSKFKKDEILASEHLGNDGWGIDRDGKYVRTVNGERQVLGLEILTNGDSIEKVNIANKISASLNEFGIPATVEAPSYDEYVGKINSHDYDIMIGELEIAPNFDLTPLVSSSGNYFSYYNANLDTLIGQMGMTQDEEQMKALFKQYGDILLNDMPFCTLFFRKGNVISGSKIKSEVTPLIGRLYSGAEKWSVK